MKKVIAIILASIMILAVASLAACGKENENKTIEQEGVSAGVLGDISEEILENSKNNEYVFEKLAAGKEVRIACLGQVDEYFSNTLLFGDAMKKLEAMGF